MEGSPQVIGKGEIGSLFVSWYKHDNIDCVKGLTNKNILQSTLQPRWIFHLDVSNRNETGGKFYIF